MARKVYACEEFGIVGVPLDDLLVNGKLDVYSEAVGRGFFDIDLRNTELVVTAKNFVGLIPLNERVAIHVVPRFPIVNLFEIIARSDARVSFLGGFKRTYSLSRNTDEGIFRLFGEQILQLMGHVVENGLLRRYQPKISSTEFCGEVLLSDTVSQFRSRGIRYKYVTRQYDLTPSVPENRIIKSALKRLVGYYSQSLTQNSSELRKQAEQLLLRFDRVADKITLSELTALAFPRLVASLPSAHSGYASPLWFSFLLETGQGVSLESTGGAQFDTFVANLADVFESYVRNTLERMLNSFDESYQVRDGNKHPLPLFVDSTTYSVKPDIYVVSQGRPIAIIDAKYKLDIKASDRYELISFCEAMQVKVAVILAPAFPGCVDRQLLGTTPSGIRVTIIRINLGASSLIAEERLMASRISDLIAETH